MSSWPSDLVGWHRWAERRDVAGFTLVELLIALSLVALMVLVLFSGLRLGARTWDAVDAAAERTEALRLANDFLIRALSQVRPAQAAFEGQPVAVFAGDRDRLEFVAPLSQHVGLAGLYILRLGLEGEGKRRKLVLTRWLMHPEILAGRDDVPAWKPLKEEGQWALQSLPPEADSAGGAFGRSILLDDVSDLEIAYFGAPSGEAGGGLARPSGDPSPQSPAPLGSGPNARPGLGASDAAAWYDAWMDQPAPPDLIRIRILSIDRSWPDLIVALPPART